MFGADYPVERSKEPQIVFIDLRLRESGPVQVDDAVNAYQKLKKVHLSCQPFVFLMSTQPTSLAEHRDEFREKAELFASQFEAAPKSWFDDLQAFEAILARYLRVLPQLRQLHDHIEGLEDAMQAAARHVKDALRALDLADYFVLHHNTVSIEKVGLGTYISDLLLDYVAYEVEGTQSIWNFAKYLDEWELADLPRSRFALTPAAAKIYTGNVLHANSRLESELERGQGPANGYFYLGDIFFEAKEYNEDNPQRALVIATPACDLVRPDELRKRTIFLCEGKVKLVTKASVPAVDDGLAAVILAHPRDTNKHLLINWNKKLLHTWREEQINEFANPDGCHWVRVARLRPLYAVQLQHAITADLSRIGVQRAPNVLVPHGIEVLLRGDTRWILLDDKDRNEATAAALADSGGREKRTVFIVTDVAVQRIRRKLINWLDNNPQANVAPVLNKLLARDDFDQSLMYLAHEVAQRTAEEQDVDITGYPFQAIVGLEDPAETQAVAFVRPGPPSRYRSVTGGRETDPSQCACLVVKFIKIPN